MNFGDCDWLVTWFNLDRDTLKLQSDPIKSQWLGLVNKGLCCLEGLSLYVLLLCYLLPLLFLIHCLFVVMHSTSEWSTKFRHAKWPSCRGSDLHFGQSISVLLSPYFASEGWAKEKILRHLCLPTLASLKVADICKGLGGFQSNKWLWVENRGFIVLCVSFAFWKSSSTCKQDFYIWPQMQRVILPSLNICATKGTHMYVG